MIELIFLFFCTYFLGFIDYVRGGYLQKEAGNNKLYRFLREQLDLVVYATLISCILGFPDFSYTSNIVAWICYLILFHLTAKVGWGWAIAYAIHNTNPKVYNGGKEEPEDWQLYFGWLLGIPLKDQPYISLFIRGLIWGMASIPLIYVGQYQYMMLFAAYSISMPLAVFICTDRNNSVLPHKIGFGLENINLPFIKIKENSWGCQEVLRGFIVGLILSIFIITTQGI